MTSLTKTLLCLIATLPSARAVTLILGDTSGNARGADAVDIQSIRPPTQPEFVASGTESVAIGVFNGAAADNSIALGSGNWTGGGSFNATVGIGNETDGNFNSAFGFGNIVYSSGVFFEQAAGAFGAFNYVDLSAPESFAFGAFNTISAPYATVFGTDITNSIGGSTMIGPSDTAKVTILSSGNVGIGTVNPTSKLHVVGNLNVTGTIINPLLNTTGTGSTSRLHVGGSGTLSPSWKGSAIVGDNAQSKVVMGYLASSTNGAVIGAHNTALNGWADLNIAGANLIFRTNETERMRISSSGNIGIGTTAPSGKIHINDSSFTNTALFERGGQAANSMFVAARALTTHTGDMGDGFGSAIGFFAKDNQNVINLLGFVGAARANASDTTGDLVFHPYSAGSGAERMRIRHDGNVGIGTTSPQATLHVAGTTRLDGNISTPVIQRITPIVIRGSEYLHTGIYRLVKIGDTQITAAGNRGLTLTVLDRATHSFVSGAHYDTFGSTAASDSLAAALNAIDKTQIGILTSADAWESNLTPALRTAFKRLGLAKAQMTSGQIRQPYAAIFDGASNAKTGGNALEIMQPGSDADQPLAEIRGWLIDGSFAVTPTNFTNALYNPPGNTQAMLVAQNGDIAVKTTIRVVERGDISMGNFTTGSNPED